MPTTEITTATSTSIPTATNTATTPAPAVPTPTTTPPPDASAATPAATPPLAAPAPPSAGHRPGPPARRDTRRPGGPGGPGGPGTRGSRGGPGRRGGTGSRSAEGSTGRPTVGRTTPLSAPLPHPASSTPPAPPAAAAPPAPRPPLPHPAARRRAAERLPHRWFADQLLLTLSGRRPVHALLGHALPAAYDRLVELAPQAPLRPAGPYRRSPAPEIRECGVFCPRRGVIEAFARIASGERVRALAFRLELCADTRWRCAALDIGPTPSVWSRTV